MKIALAGNPNVGKSTLFNSLTGLHQHTGNWTGKTVDNKCGKIKKTNHIIYDLPGTYSLSSHSKEEEVTRDFIVFEEPDKVIIVCDACLLERNLYLVLQILEITDNVIVCLNLMDEAKKKQIKIDSNKLSNILGVPVIKMVARSKKGINELINNLDNKSNSFKVKYNENIENIINLIIPLLNDNIKNKRFVALKLLDDDLSKKIIDYYKIDDKIVNKIEEYKSLIEGDITAITSITIVNEAEKIIKEVVTYENKNYNKKMQKIDKILTNKITGIPIMLLLLMLVFFITIKGANYPSNLLYDFFSSLEDDLLTFLPEFLVLGVYRVLTWVISVMVPPMAIFFPLFSLLEDLGYLPRIAFNLDGIFKKCHSCGKQALTMCMGFGCNAVGVSGTRIIDSERERLIAILTNVFVPCNGRFPLLIALITMFLTTNSLLSVLILLLIIIFGVLITFLVSYLLSKTLLKGKPSSFVLELPPFRKPQVFKVIIRSIFDKTLKVLGRAIIISAPAGLLIYILANNYINDISLLNHISNFLDYPAKLMGLDGVILMAFILGFPANEIVIPIMIMTYMQTNSLVDITDLTNLKELFINNGWTYVTAICTMVFSLIHFPCSTTCLTIKAETKSYKWMFLSFVIPTILGFIVCFLINLIFKIV